MKEERKKILEEMEEINEASSNQEEKEGLQIEDVLYKGNKRKAALRKPYFIDPEKTEAAIRESYFRYNLSRQEVITYTGAPVDVVDTWLYGPFDPASKSRPNNGWHSVRETENGRIYKMAIKAKKDCLEDIVNMGAGLVRARIQDMLARGNEITPSEILSLITAIEKADKILKVDDGKPTDIKRNIRTTPDTVRAKMAEIGEVDPYGQYPAPKKEDDVQ